MATQDQPSVPAIDETPISPVSTHSRKMSLELHLKQRPGKSELVGKNILHSPNVASSLQEAQRELEKHMRADSLNGKISHRPSPEQLLKTGVLHDDPRAPDEKYTDAIEEEYAKREGGA